MSSLPNSTSSPPKRKRLYVFLLGIGFLLTALLIGSWLIRPVVYSPPERKTEQVQQAKVPEQSAGASTREVPKESKGSPVDLKSQIEQVLAGIKGANQKKDLSQLLHYYSPNFPQLPQRAQSFSRLWKVYDYPKMEFKIIEVRLLSDNEAVAKVTWDVETQNISTKKINEVSKTYLTRFVKESGQWRIKSLENVK
jgi:hypothetical protein